MTELRKDSQFNTINVQRDELHNDISSDKCTVVRQQFL